jgi:hypothetical protein
LAMPPKRRLPRFTDARREYLDASQRVGRAVPIRRLFVQQGAQRRPRPGPLAEMVRRHDATALDLFLLAMAKATAPVESKVHGVDVHSVVLHNVVWGRLLGDVPASTVTRAWGRLEDDYGLVRRRRNGRLMDVLILSEDGSGDDYVRPRDGGAADSYLQVPFDYWLEPVHGDADRRPWIDALTLPAKAMLLIGLSLKPGFILPVRLAESWYGLSSDSAQRGLDELRQHAAIDSQYTLKPSALAPDGVTREYHHTMLAPFERRSALKPRLRVVS